MEIVYACCCGIDVHKKMIVACLIKGRRHELRQFGTTTEELRELSSWLLGSKCEMIAMESTGSYWKPLYNIFELTGLESMVINAAHMKALPGRKTDVKDAEWIADLLRHGLLKASYIPDREQRELREISRYRKSLIEERARELNRLQKMLEGANIKLSGIVSNINGLSSRKLLDQIITDKRPNKEEVKELIHRKMYKKLGEIMAAIDGITSPLQRKLFSSIINHIDDMTKRIEDMDQLIKDYLHEYEKAIAAIEELPGIGRTSAETILAEIGKDMGRFPSAAHLCSCLCIVQSILSITMYANQNNHPTTPELQVRFPIIDKSEILTEEQKENIFNIYSDFECYSFIQISLLIVNSPNDTSGENFLTNLSGHWKERIVIRLVTSTKKVELFWTNPLNSVLQRISTNYSNIFEPYLSNGKFYEAALYGSLEVIKMLSPDYKLP